MFSNLTKSLTIIVCLIFTSSVFAQTTPADTATAKPEEAAGPLGYLKSHFSAAYHGEFYAVRKDALSLVKEDTEIQDFNQLHNPSIAYRPFKNWKLSVSSEFKYSDALVKGTYINRHYRSLVTLTQENVLTEKDNGVKLDLSLVRRIFDRNKGAAKSYGNSRVNASLSKKFNDKLSTSFLVQYLANDPVPTQVAATTWKHSIELIPSFTFQITDKLSYFFNDDFIINTPWLVTDDYNLSISHEMNIGVLSFQSNDQNSTYLQVKYLHSEGAPYTDTTANSDSVEYYIGHTYSFTPKISATVEVGSELFAGKDGRSFFSKKLEYPEFALYLDMSL
jgi:hypothetical protein